MYTRTHGAACWADTPNDRPRQHKPRPERVQRWASHRLHTRRGTALALRFDGEDARVLVEDQGMRQWLPMDWVMSHRQAEHWIKNGFAR